MDGDRPLGLGDKLGPQDATDADRRALGGERLFVTHIEAIAGSHLAAKVDRRGEGPPRLEPRGRRHASLCQRCVERLFDDALRGNFARERLAGGKARRLVVTAQQALLRRAHLFRRCIIGGNDPRRRAENKRSGERRDERYLQ